MKVWSLFAIILVFTVQPNHADDFVEQCHLVANRLSPTFVPENYDLVLEPDLRMSKFTGTISIILRKSENRCNKSSPSLNEFMQTWRRAFACFSSDDSCKRQLVLNVHRSLQVDNIILNKLSMGNENEAEPLNIERSCRDDEHEFLQITADRRLDKFDKLRLDLKFGGKIRPKSEPHGLYSTLTELQAKPGLSRGDTRPATVRYRNVVSHLFPAEARSLFPCLDQPDLKSTFKLKLIHHKMYKSISNSPILSRRPKANDNQKVVVEFAETYPMSTYVFGLAIGQFETIQCRAEGRTKSVPVTAYAPVGRAKEATFTLETVCKAIPLIESYFKSDFPLGKLDLVVGGEMREEARENWGLITFTEDFLLTDSGTTNELRAQIAKLVAHVVLQHWMGNLVSARWWDDQWLFEGFAIWRSHGIAAQLYPEYDYEFSYLLQVQSRALDSQSATKGHPIKSYADLSAQAELNLLDAPTSNKAAALYEMLANFWSASIVHDAIVSFVDANKFGSGDAAKLIASLEDISGAGPLEPFFKSWLDQPGAPLLSVARLGRRLQFRQERLERQHSPESDQQTWLVPVIVQFFDSASNRREDLAFTMRGREHSLECPAWFDPYSPNHAVKVNNGSGFYRVRYDQSARLNHRRFVELKLFGPLDRLNLIDDLRALLDLKLVTYDEVVESLACFRAETSGGVLSGLARLLSSLEQFQPRNTGALDKLAFELFGHILNGPGFQPTTFHGHADENGRQDALMALVSYNHKQAIGAALEAFAHSDNLHLAPFLRRPVYLAVVNHGSGAQFKQLIEGLKQIKSRHERRTLIGALVPYADKASRKKSLAALIESEQL